MSDIIINWDKLLIFADKLRKSKVMFSLLSLTLFDTLLFLHADLFLRCVVFPLLKELIAKYCWQNKNQLASKFLNFDLSEKHFSFTFDGQLNVVQSAEPMVLSFSFDLFLLA